jgi:hypothetical protein
MEQDPILAPPWHPEAPTMHDSRPRPSSYEHSYSGSQDCLSIAIFDQLSIALRPEMLLRFDALGRVCFGTQPRNQQMTLVIR